jgi:hypothetical protein
MALAWQGEIIEVWSLAVRVALVLLVKKVIQVRGLLTEGGGVRIKEAAAYVKSKPRGTQKRAPVLCPSLCFLYCTRVQHQETVFLPPETRNFGTCTHIVGAMSLAHT